jgi:filamentous hemagglutinin family protein
MRNPLLAVTYRFALLLFAVQVVSAFAAGSVVTDNTLGAVRTINGPNYPITQTYGQIVGGAGGNLFFSFGTFNIGTSETATFSSTTSVSNVITRVTGSASSIDGQIASTIGGANFFLIDPLGISFGPNASLNISGSFHATTADYVKLGSNGRFDATTPANSVLTSAAPSAFGFLGPTPASISFNGSQLSVPAGQTLSVVAGDISLTNGAHLQALSGVVNLASVASGGEAGLTTGGVDVSSFAALGAISLAGNSYVNASEPVGSVTGGGSIFIRGGQLTLDQSFLYADTKSGNGQGIDIQAQTVNLLNGAQIQALTNGSGNAGSVSVNSNDITISGTGGGFSSAIFASAGAGSTGNAGDIQITTQNLNLMGGGELIVSTRGAGNGGTTLVNASNIAISGKNSGIFATANSGSTGNGGDILISTQSLTVAAGGLIDADTSGSGKGGVISVTADNITIDGTGSGGFFTGISSDVFANGNGGDIFISTQGLTLTNTGQITVDTHGPGKGGLISVTANNITIDGTGSGGFFTGISSDVFANGNGGDVLIATQGLALTGGGQISASTNNAGNAGFLSITANNIAISGSNSGGNSGIFATAETGSTGNGGGIFITTQGLTLTNTGVITADTSGPGKGGVISVTADNITIDGSASANFTGISSDVNANGDGGGILITTQSLALTGGGQISASTFDAGNAGIISVKANNIAISGNSSGLFATAETGSTGNGGGILITTQSLSVAAGGFIIADTSGSGKGGLISVDANNIAIDGSASANFTGISSDVYANGDGGDVLITTQGLTLTGGGQISASTSDSGNAGFISVKANNISISGNSSGISAIAESSGLGGQISITAGQSVTLDSGAQITSKSTGSGNAGDIIINAGASLRMDNSAITAAADSADGGNIKIFASDLVSLNGSRITTSVGGGAGNGGNILIDPTFVVLNGSSIIANAVAGNGGNIDIIAGNIFQSPDSVISASSQLGISGTVTITSPIVDLTSSLVTLPTSYLDVSALLAERCAARLAGKASSFVMAGRGGMPVEPAGLLPSSAALHPPAVAARVGGGSGNQSLLLAQNDFGCTK